MVVFFVGARHAVPLQVLAKQKTGQQDPLFLQRLFETPASFFTVFNRKDEVGEQGFKYLQPLIVARHDF